MINISHVKKYEQSSSFCKYLRINHLIFFSAVLSLICTTSFYVFAFNSQFSAQNPKLDIQGHELPLEISEKYYKKEAILTFNEAVKKWESKSVDEAIKLWSESIKIDPNLWIAYLGLGQAYEFKKEYSKSLEAYKQYLKLSPKLAQDRSTVNESVNFLAHILRHGEEAIKNEDYLSFVKTKHQGKELYVRWDLTSPIKIYFYPAVDVPNYRAEFEQAFLEGAKIWQEVLPNLKFEVLDNKQKEKEKEVIDRAQIKVVFPSRFKVKGDPSNPIASQIDAQSFPIIRDKKNFRVLGVIMVSPYIYYQTQIAIPLESLSKLKQGEQINKLKIISAREVGHALGLWGFSPNPDDIMFEGEVSELRLTRRDKNTIKKLYKLNPEEEEILTNN